MAKVSFAYADREPTVPERQQERAVLFTLVLDFCTTVLMLIAATVTGSLTLLSEAVRCVPPIATDSFACWVMRSINRGRLRNFQYGAGKMEQFVRAITGVGLAFGGLWVLLAIIDKVVSDTSTVAPLSMVGAAIVNGFNALVNVWTWYAMYSARQPDETEVFRNQRQNRFTILLGSLFLQVMLTMAALTHDASIALSLDVIAACFVVYVMLARATSVLVETVSDLIDKEAEAGVLRELSNCVAPFISADATVSIKTRRSGKLTFAELYVSSDGFRSIADLAMAKQKIREQLANSSAALDVTVRVATHGGARNAAAGNQD